MKNRIRKLLTVLLVLAALFSAAMFLIQQRDISGGTDTYADALALASSGKPDRAQPAPETVPPAEGPQWVPAAPDPEDPYIRELEELDLEALREVNPDVIGWILIPDTVISYPLMQGADNDYYLKHTWDGKRYAVGSIFMEYLNKSDLTDFNTILYGHNMNNGSMFASLREYRDQAYWEEHPCVYVRSDRGVYRYEIFSSYLAKVDSNTYGLRFSSEQSRTAFLNNALLDSVIDTGLEPEPTDRVLTLSTCSGRGHTTRWVVHARLKMVLQQS